MIKVSIHSAEIRSMSGNAKETGKPYAIAFQEGYFHTVGLDGKLAPYPQKVEFMLDKGKDGAALFYPVGEYQLDPSAVYVDRNGRLAIRARLKPLAASVTPRAAG